MFNKGDAETSLGTDEVNEFSRSKWVSSKRQIPNSKNQVLFFRFAQKNAYFVGDSSFIGMTKSNFKTLIEYLHFFTFWVLSV